MALASPCLDICKFDRKADLCVGCFRTTAEIRQWRKFTENRRRQILAERRRRMAVSVLGEISPFLSKARLGRIVTADTGVL